MSSPVLAFGSITWWGFSPATDLQNLVRINSSDEFHFLMVGSGDLRHVLLTIARRYRHAKRKLNFYIVENNYELLARAVLQLTLACEPEVRMGLQEKTEIFLELLGNTLVRPQTMEYVQTMATTFIKMITDFDYCQSVLPYLKLDALKFKERDFLEAIFKFWRSKDTRDFDAAKCWDLRLRQHLKARYDGIPNIFDWDFNMKLLERGAEIINGRVYSRWRHLGIAFELRDAEYDVCNRTLASGVVSLDAGGNRVARRGFFGDILVSPFIVFGIESENKSLLEKRNGVYGHSGAHLSEYNVLTMFFEMARQEKYQPKNDTKEKDTEAAGGDQAKNMCSIEEVDEEEEEEATEAVEELTLTTETDSTTSANKASTDYPYEPLDIEGVEVHLLPQNALRDLPKKCKYQQLFTHAYFSNSMVHLLKEESNGISKIMAKESALIMESALFMLELNMEQVELFAEKANEMANALNFKPVGERQPKTDKLFVFKRLIAE